jgi:UDP-glucose 6-dehydrogenase
MLHPGNSPMKVGVIGTGHVGAITCLSLASVGHRVVGCDADFEKFERSLERSLAVPRARR